MTGSNECDLFPQGLWGYKRVEIDHAPPAIRVFIGRHGEPEVEVPGKTMAEVVCSAAAMLWGPSSVPECTSQNIATLAKR